MISVKTIRQIQVGLKTLLSYSVIVFPVIAFMLVGALVFGLFFNTNTLKTASEWMTKDSRGIFIIGVCTISGLLLAISQEIRLKLEKSDNLADKQNIWSLRIYRDIPNGCKAGLHDYLRDVASKLEGMGLINSNVIGSRDFFDYQKLDGYISLTQFMNIYLTDLDSLPTEYREVVMSKFHEICYVGSGYVSDIQKTQVWWFFHQILVEMDVNDSPQSIDLVVKSIIFDKVSLGPSRTDPFQSIEVIRKIKISYSQFEKIIFEISKFLDPEIESRYLDRVQNLIQDKSATMTEKLVIIYIEFFNSKGK